jgi:hypothetical protein
MVTQTKVKTNLNRTKKEEDIRFPDDCSVMFFL